MRHLGGPLRVAHASTSEKEQNMPEAVECQTVPLWRFFGIRDSLGGIQTTPEGSMASGHGRRPVGLR